MKKEELIKDVNKLIIKICEYYGASRKENHAFFEYLKDCEKALLDLLNEFNEKGEKINEDIPFDNIFNYKWYYEFRDRDYKDLQKRFEQLEKRIKE